MIISQYQRTLLSGCTLDLGGEAVADEAVLGVELLAGFNGVVDAGEGSGLATTERGAQAEYADLLGRRLVERGELFLEVGPGDTGLVGVDDVTREVCVRIVCCMTTALNG